MSEFITAFFLVLGSLFIFIGALGILKFPSTLMRAHALSKALLLGISLILLSIIPSLETDAEGIKIFLAISFLALTIPIAGHIFALYSSSER
jgi:monovalent cation/proton antiporter MnhG/PhaG subunit